jgi:hypothetical protein
MHPFSELIERSALMTLSALNSTQQHVHEELQTSARTPLVKALQAVMLSKAVLAVGMFSIFEARLQDGLKCAEGFREASTILDAQGETALSETFGDLILAINVLKHGQGRSYQTLVAKVGTLPFTVKQPGQNFFHEGDVSEVVTLVKVDDAFVRHCVDVIQQVSAVIRRVRPDFHG